MKPRKLLELERRRLGLIDEARSAFEDLKTCADPARLAELEREHDKRMRELDLNKLEIDEATMVEDEVRSQRPPYQVTTTDAADRGAMEWRGETSTGWVDQNGEPVRVLKSSERWADGHPEGIGMGNTIRAMVTGARNDQERRALGENIGPSGGYTVPTPLATWFIDKLRTQSVAIRAGALTVPMESQTLAIARLDSDPAVGWRAENDPIAMGDPTFGQVTLTARSLAGMVKVSRELLADTANAGQMIEQAISKVMALELDRAVLFGDGSSNSPTGVINTAGISTVSMGTNGATPSSYGPMIDSIYALQAANSAYPTAAIMHPRTGASIAKMADGVGNPLGVPEMVSRVPMLATTAASITETQGSATGVCSSMIYADFTQMLIGMREQVRVFTLNELYAATGQLALIVHARADVVLAHNASFCRLLGIKP